MVDVLSSTVNALFVHLVSCTLSIHSVFMFASVNLLLVFFFVWSWFIYVWHGVTLVFVHLVSDYIFDFGFKIKVVKSVGFDVAM